MVAPPPDLVPILPLPHPAYPSAVDVEVKINGVWESLTADVVDDIVVKRGIKGSGYLDRVASTGTMTFVLRNDSACLGGIAGFYIPQYNNAKNGWGLGLSVRLTVTYDETPFVKFYGHITAIKTSPDIYTQRVEVVVSDWFDYAASHSIRNLPVEFNKDISGAVTSILSKMPVAPLNTQFSTGVDTFPTVFDGNNKSTKALNEFNKLALSEYGYVYMRTDPLLGETLVVENRRDRSATSVPNQVPLASISSDFLCAESGDGLLTEDDLELLVNQTQLLALSSTMYETEVLYGDRLVNKVTVTNHPRKVDTSHVVLFTLSNPVEVKAGETKPLVRTSYKDPDNLAESVSGMDMQTPVATTDYRMYQNSDGTGFDLTPSLSVTVTFYNNEFTYVFQNMGLTTGWVTFFQVRGKGVYTYEELEYEAEDPASAALLGDRELHIDQKYQNDIYTSAAVAELILAQSSIPTRDVSSVKILANIDESMLYSFLTVDIGSLILLFDQPNYLNSYYYVQNIEFTIKQGGIIWAEIGVKEAISLTEAYWMLGSAGFSELGSTTIVGY